jgi:serine/threonine protein kinase/tetratricopeptide (TPR) repeat protein
MSDVPSRLESALAGRYSVLRELGEGGMATVYLAEDVRHHRNVALKVLKPELAAAVGAARFLSEIRVTANLQHPHILPLFDSGEADAFLFYTMPYVEGETLRSRMDREGPFEVDAAVRIATDVAEALQVAHERGIVHRDVKPSNILLSRGGALVADFGIAGATALPKDARLTRTGSSIGTVGYMSPEQVAGDGEVDPRADIYSLGCVLFEMLSGEPPFGRGSSMSVLARQLSGPTPSVRASRPEVPTDLEQALATALAREPADRFESISAFAGALSANTVQTAAAVAAGKTVLVLPFVNRSPDPDNEYFSDGLTEEVISDLAGVSALGVISRNSAMALKGTTTDTRTLASRHGVTHLVTGSVRKAGSSLRITVELVEASTDRPLWSHKFSGTMEDVFQFQEEIARQIVEALEVRLTDTERREAADRPIEDPVAYDCYLKARQLTYNWTEESQHGALGLVNEAIRLTGETPLLLATMGQIRWNMVNSGVTSAEDGLPQALELANRALAIQPDHHVAIFVRGLVAATRGQIEPAIRDLYRAHRMRPGDWNVLIEWVRWSMSAGLENVGRYAEQVVRIDPLTPFSHLGLGHQFVMRGLRAEAIPPLRRALALSHGLRLHMLVAWSMAEAELREESADILERVAAPPSDDPHRAAMLFLAHALRGDEGQALRHLAPAAVHRLQSEWDFLALASGYALIGQRTQGVASLRRATEAGLIHYPFMSERSHLLDGLRGEPAFEALMAEIRPRWEAVVAWERGLEA